MCNMQNTNLCNAVHNIIGILNTNSICNKRLAKCNGFKMAEEKQYFINLSPLRDTQ